MSITGTDYANACAQRESGWPFNEPWMKQLAHAWQEGMRELIENGPPTTWPAPLPGHENLPLIFGEPE